MANILLLNEGFEVSPLEAGHMWSEGVPLVPETPGEYCPSPTRVLKTPDQKWVIRRRILRTTTELRHARGIVHAALEEFKILEALGIDVISRAITPSAGETSVFTVTPFIAGMRPCGGEVFKATLASKIGAYYAGSTGRAALDDIANPSQYSHMRPGAETPFLHDVDPYIDIRAL